MQTIFEKILTFNEELIEEMGISPAMLNNCLGDFGVLGSRVKVTKGKIDFELPKHNDTPEEIKAKFDKFLDTEHAAFMDEVCVEINKMDRVQDKNLAPGHLPDEKDKKK
jgi:hypothetical protein